METIEIRGNLKSILKEILKDLAFTAALVLIMAGGLYLYSGVWPPLVSVEGVSMYPNLQGGDMVVLRGIDRVPVTTGQTAIPENYKMFNGFGDVIVYSPMGNRSLTPVIHRAVYWVKQGQPMWPGGPPAPHDGYITLGDNNYFYDQSTSISPDEPVKPEWILGVSRFRVPYLGMLRGIV